jgi:HAD superfamily hydrolase (TIGR01509 family)
MLRGVIFDFDGVLVDSEAAHFEAFRTVLAAEVEGEVTRAEYDEHYLGYDDHTCVRRALELRGRAASPGLVSDLVDLKWQAYDEGLSRIPFFEGAEDLVLALHAASIPLAIASGSHRNEIDSILRARGLFQYFRGVISADDVVNFKPHPEPYLRARALLGAVESPEGLVAIEDSTTGMASARAADLRVIGVTNSRPRERLGLAHHVVDSLLELSVQDIARIAARSALPL